MPYRTVLLLFLIVLTACSGVEPLAQEQSPPAPSAPLTLRAEPQPTVVTNNALLSLAADQRLSGEYEDQITTLQQVLAGEPSPDEARAARFGLAEAALLQGRSDDAAAQFAALIDEETADVWTERGLFLLARAHEAAGRHEAAVEAYTRYRALQTPLEPYATLRQAAQERAMGQTDQAIANYEAVAQQPIARARRAEALENLIALYGLAGRTDLQLARYRDLLTIAQNPSYRAQVLWRAAQLAGSTDEAREWLRELVRSYSARGEAYQALGVLLTDPAGAVPPFEAGNVEFLHEQYAAAVPMFDAAIANGLPPEQEFEARRLRALSLRAQALYNDALHELGALAQQRPIITITGTAQAELDYVQTAGWSGNVPWAIDGYRRFADRYAEHELAAEALWRAIQLEQGQGNQAGAMTAAIDLGRRYPGSKQAHLALQQAGLHFYLNGDRDRALEAWQLLGDGAQGWEGALGHFWAGSTLVQRGQADPAGAHLHAAVEDAPQSFYAQRAREMLNQTGEGDMPLGSGPSADEQAAVVAWIDGWTDGEVGSMATEVANAPEVIRARELGALGLRNEARDEWFGARDEWNDDPLRLWHLAFEANAAHEPYAGLKAAERVLALSPDKIITPATPTGLLRLIYPTPYARVVQRESQHFGIDPRLLYGLIRQESLFNPDATSWVGARGLGQVMPATGEGIAQNLRVENYHADLLYRPAVSIRFGAHYISAQLRAFDNNPLAAASAYNGGPGNAARWLRNTDDRDLFPELIDYRETRDYVKIVYGNWGMYRILYAP